VDFLATNQRVIAPCLDVPLASVQLEHTGQIEMQLNATSDRKFSFPWPGQTAKVDNNSLPAIDARLLDINNSPLSRDQNINCILGSDSSSEIESIKPLLGDSVANSAPGSSKNDAARYVNLQPGPPIGAFLDIPNSDTCSIPLNERILPLPGTNFNNISFL
jgi:hypothetical protein